MEKPDFVWRPRTFVTRQSKHEASTQAAITGSGLASLVGYITGFTLINFHPDWFCVNALLKKKKSQFNSSFLLKTK